MHPIDLGIVLTYLILMSLVGWWSAKKASRNAESYFLASKSLPWYVIGVAHGSSGVDITGTMWFVMMLLIYGVKATWLLWVWPLFSVVFRMVYLGTWVRRSNVLTGAEWMRTRFGHSRGAELAYISVVVYALVHVVGFLSYAFRGIGEFTRPFFPWNVPDEWYGMAMLLVTGIYCVVGGMYGVVMNDLIQFGLKVVAAVGSRDDRHLGRPAGAAHGPRTSGMGPVVLWLEAQSRLEPPDAALEPAHLRACQRGR
jgi:solute:Na+ symporter, SSS family